MKFRIVFFLFVFAAYSCTHLPQLKVHDQTITIKLPDSINKIEFKKFSDVYDSVKIVRLETIPESLIGRVDKILVFKDKIFVLDQLQRKSVLEFDFDGKFVRRFGTVGSGPGKYDQPNDISIQNDKLSIWVSNFRKFIVFDLSGQFLYEVKTKSYGKSGTMISKDLFGLYLDIGTAKGNKEKFNLKLIDKKGNIVHLGFEKNDDEISKGIFFFSQFKNETLISPGYSNTIFSVNGSDTINKKYFIDFGKHTIPSEYLSKYRKAYEFFDAIKKSDFGYLSDYSESTDYLMFSFVYNANSYNCFYSKKSHQLKIANAWANNIHGVFPGINKTLYKNNVIAFYDPTTINSFKETSKSTTSDSELSSLTKGANSMLNNNKAGGSRFIPSDFRFTKSDIDLLNSIQPSDNPVILIQRLKAF